MKKKLIIVILLVSLLFGCSNKNITPISKSNFYLGTIVTIKIYDKADDEIFEKVFNRIKEIENKMSINVNESEVISINKNSGINYVNVSNDTFKVIEKGLYYSELSKGYFDITIGPLVKLWNIGSEDARVPTAEEINEKIKKVNYKNVLLDKKNKEVFLRDTGMIIDLGGIAKGYAADEIKKILTQNGIKHAIINLGGNVYTIGSKPENSKWKIGIQNPIENRGQYLGIVKVKDKSVVTSGVYERYLEVDGKRYHHILNPYTGYPVENDLLAVSIISDKSIDGDGLSTSIFALGLKDGKKLVESLKGVDAIFITKDKEIYITSGLIDNFDLVNKEFILKDAF